MIAGKWTRAGALYFIVTVPIGLYSACAKAPNAPAASEVAHPDSLKLEKDHPNLAFVHIESVGANEAPAAISLPGRVQFDEDRTQRVGSPIDGRVTTMLVKVGDVVRVGQPLVELSSPKVSELQSDAQKAASDLAVAERAIERVHKLQTDGAVSEKEVAQADGDWKKARSDATRTSAQLRVLGISPTDPAITVALRAQVKGIVVERSVLAGQEVRADAPVPLLTISDLSQVWVVADAYEQDLSLLQEKANVSVRVPAYPGETFTGTIQHIGDVVDPSSRTVKVRCVIPNPQRRLKPEMFARIEIESRPGQKIVSIPARSVLSEGDRRQVIVVSNDQIFRARAVDVGPEIEGRVRVIGGLTEGERVVTDGALFLKQEIAAQ